MMDEDEELDWAMSCEDDDEEYLLPEEVDETDDAFDALDVTTILLSDGESDDYEYAFSSEEYDRLMGVID